MHTSSKQPNLIILSGLPGVGKTTIGRELARRLRAVFLRIDTIEHALSRSVLHIHSAEDAGYVAAYALARDNLLIGHDVVADAVNPIELTRNAWLNVANAASARALEVEIFCTDKIEHRRRVDSRRPFTDGERLPTWTDIQQREYQPWHRAHSVIDTAGQTIEQNVTELLSTIQQ